MAFIIPSLKHKQTPPGKAPGGFSRWLRKKMYKLRTLKHRLRAARLKWEINSFEKRRAKEAERLDKKRHISQASGGQKQEKNFFKETTIKQEKNHEVKEIKNDEVKDLKPEIKEEPIKETSFFNNDPKVEDKNSKTEIGKIHSLTFFEKLFAAFGVSREKEKINKEEKRPEVKVPEIKEIKTETKEEVKQEVKEEPTKEVSVLSNNSKPQDKSLKTEIDKAQKKDKADSLTFFEKLLAAFGMSQKKEKINGEEKFHEVKKEKTHEVEEEKSHQTTEVKPEIKQEKEIKDNPNKESIILFGEPTKEDEEEPIKAASPILEKKSLSPIGLEKPPRPKTGIFSAFSASLSSFFSSLSLFKKSKTKENEENNESIKAPIVVSDFKEDGFVKKVSEDNQEGKETKESFRDKKIEVGNQLEKNKESHEDNKKLSEDNNELNDNYKNHLALDNDIPIVFLDSDEFSREIKKSDIKKKESVPLENSLPKDLNDKKIQDKQAQSVKDSVNATNSDLLAGKKSKLALKLSKEREEEELVRHRLSVENRFWQSYRGPQTNLVKNQQVVFFNWKQKTLVLSLSVILCCLIISVAYIGLLIWQKDIIDKSRESQINYQAINKQIAEKETELREVIDFNNSLVFVSSIIKNHVSWVGFALMLEETTLTDVYWERFSGDISGKYVIPGIARNLAAQTSQEEVLRKHKWVKSVTTQNSQALVGGNETQQTSSEEENKDENQAPSSGGDNRIMFNLEIEIDPLIFVGGN